MLSFGASILVLLPNANASPLPATTSVEEFRITPIPLPTGTHTINLSSLSSAFCQDNVRSRGCEPPASLTKKEEHPVPTSLCGKHCMTIKGECICHPKDPALLEILPLIIMEIEGKLTLNSTPTATSSMEHRPILETRAVDGTNAYHTLSPKDKEEELKAPLCHKDRGCMGEHGILPPAEAEVVSKRDTDHPALTHRDAGAEPTFTQTSTMTQFPTPIAAVKACPENDRQCQGSFLSPPQLEKGEQKNPKMFCGVNDRECWALSLPPHQLENGIHNNPEKLCGVNGRMCQDNWYVPPTKAEKEEKRDVDIVLPTATGTSEMKIDANFDANCLGNPYLCLRDLKET